MRRFALLYGQRWRRDRVQLALWILGPLALAAATSSAVGQTFGTQDERTSLLNAAVANPVILLFRGLPSGSSSDELVGFLILPFLAMLAAFMSSFLAVRHTRMDEEQQRAELVAATPAGRVVPLVATLVHGVLANLVLAALVALAFVGLGQGVGGAVTAGLATGATGAAFLGVSLLAAQLVRTSRGANSIGVWAIMIAYLACGIGNALGTPSADLTRMTSAPLAWFSPFGWAENTRPWDADDLRPLLISLALAAITVACAFAVQSRRDLGDSLLPERTGRSAAGPMLSGSLGLVWRLSRGALLGWAIGGLVSGLLATRLADVISDIGTSIPSVDELIQALSAQGSLEQGAVVIFFTLVGILAACAAVQTVAKARQEEAHGTAEPVLAGAVERVRWVADYVIVGFLGIVLTIAAAVGGAALGLASLSDPDWTLLGDAAISGAGQIAAAAVFLVITALVLAVLPRLTIVAGWTLVLVGLVLGLFGALFSLPDALVDASPFAVTPTVQGDTTDLRGLGWLIAAVVVGATVTVLFARRRERAADG